MMVFLRFLEVLEGLERSVGVEKSLFGAELRFFWHRRSIPRWREHGKCLAPLEAHKTLVQILRHNRTQPCAQPSYAERTSAHNPCAYNPRSWTHNEFFSVENSSRGGISTGGRCRWTIISKCQWSLKSRVRPKHCFFLFLFLLVWVVPVVVSVLLGMVLVIIEVVAHHDCYSDLKKPSPGAPTPPPGPPKATRTKQNTT